MPDLDLMTEFADPIDRLRARLCQAPEDADCLRELSRQVAKRDRHSGRALALSRRALALRPADLSLVTDAYQMAIAAAALDEAIALHGRIMAWTRGRGDGQHRHLDPLHRMLATKLAKAERFADAGAVILDTEPSTGINHTLRDQAILLEVHRPEAALRRLLALPPERRNRDTDLATTTALIEYGQLDEAARRLDALLAADPDFAAARMNRAMIRLYQGDYAGGWADYRARWATKDRREDRLPGVQLWRGEDLAGRRLLIWGEQGLGDELMFARFLTAPALREARVTLVARPLTRAPLARSFPGVHVVSRLAKDAAADFQIGLASLPGVLGIRPEDLPVASDYLTVPQARVETVQATLPAGLKLGICWSANVKRELGPVRSIPLAAFAPLAALPEVSLVSLQQAHGLDQLDGAPFPVHRPAIDGGDLDDTLALIRACDGVVSCDTAVVHMAAAQSVPTEVALKPVPDWRFADGPSPDESDMPCRSRWYPSARLYRQERYGDWQGLMRKIADQLAGDFGII